jgi:alpha-D-ribose 1-methylphosphonate 5-triphosphate diphosphatase PhnM
MKKSVQNLSRALAGILCALTLSVGVCNASAPSASVNGALAAHCDIVIAVSHDGTRYVITEHDAYGYGIADRVTTYETAEAAQAYMWQLYTEFNICNA